MADVLPEPQRPQATPPESQTMTMLAESIFALSERVGILESRLAPKPRRLNTGTRRTGWRPGRHRFGCRPHSKIPGRLVEDVDEQHTINLIVQARADGIGPRSICSLLDSLGRSRRGKKWSPNGHSLVAAILQRAR
jgi:hypothetical protein